MPSCIPDGVNDLKVRKALLNDFAIEIGGGLGQFAGKVWRVGLMGHSCRRKNVFLFLAALETVLKAEGFKARPGGHRGGDGGLCVGMRRYGKAT